MNRLMDCRSLPPALTPHSSRLYRSFVEDFDRVRAFYGHPPTRESVSRTAQQLSRDGARLTEVASVLQEQNARFGSGPATTKNVERLASGAVAVVTGQQVGLFSGPSYSIYKALSAIEIAQEIEKAGIPAVAIFWQATEDHDIAEVNHCFWGTSRELQRLTLASTSGDGRPVGMVALGDGITPVVEEAVRMLEGPGGEEIEFFLRESYAPDETLGSAFGRLLARLFRDSGLILLDPMDARLHRLAMPVYRQALERHAELSGELVSRKKSLEKAGFHAQVKINERSTLLFLTEAGRRIPLRVRNGQYVAAERTFSRQEILERMDAAPEVLTPNVLLRPVVQDTLLPTAAYVAGPAEIAYYAQSAVLYERLLGRMPVILPRASFTLVESKVRSLLKKYGLNVEDVWKGRQYLRSKLESGYLPKTLAKTFDQGEKDLRSILKKLERPLRKMDKTLAGALETVTRKMNYQYSKLRTKAGRAQNARTGLLDTHERLLVESLYPERMLQERVHCLLPALSRQGIGLLGELQKRAGFSARGHQILEL